MKKVLLLVANLLAFSLHSQFIPVLLRYDNIEAFTWSGAWLSTATAGYYTNASVSSNASAAMYGLGSSTSLVEQNWYILPNVAGLDATRSHLFKFRLGSYRFTSLNSTRGVDAADYIEVRISTDGGINYVREIRVTGFSNAHWNYNNTASITKTADGTNTIYSPSAGGDRTLTGDGYSTIELTIPAGATQLAVDIYCRANSAGEEWWLDNIELFMLEPDGILPVDLVSFDGIQIEDKIKLAWQTAQEFNNSHFIVERSIDAVNWDSIAFAPALGNGTGSQYSSLDKRPFSGVNYYRLKQYDFDGTENISNVIAVEYIFGHVEAYVYQHGNTIYLKNCEDFSKFKLIDASGKTIREENLDQHNSFETSELSSGLYYLNLIGEQLNTATLRVRIMN